MLLVMGFGSGLIVEQFLHFRMLDLCAVTCCEVGSRYCRTRDRNIANEFPAHRY